MLPTTPRRQPRSICNSCSMPFSTTATRVSRGVTLTRISSDINPPRMISTAAKSRTGAGPSPRNDCRTDGGRNVRPCPGSHRHRPCPAPGRWRRRPRSLPRLVRANVTSDTHTACASRPALTSETAVTAWWVRPDRRRSMSAASSPSPGLPNTSSSRITSVSAPRTMACGTVMTVSNPAPAFSRATRRTYSMAGSVAWRCSGISTSRTPKSTPRRASNCARRGDLDAR